MFQQTMIVGNLGMNPEMRFTPTGVPVCSFSVATSKSWTGQDGKKQEKTVWFRVTCWRKQAEIVNQYLTKGSKVMVVGEMEESKPYTDKNGETKASLNITAQMVKFLSGRGDVEAGGGGPTNDNEPLDETEIPF